MSKEILTTIYFCSNCEQHYADDELIKTSDNTHCSRQHPADTCCHAGHRLVSGGFICDTRTRILNEAN